MPRRSDRVFPARCCVEPLEPRTLFAADPIVPDNPLWTIPRGTAVIDGHLDDADWSAAYLISRTQATRADGAVAVRMMYNDAGLFLSADVQDTNLWADGMGGGAGNRWEVESDDSITFYFDPNGSRDEFFQAADFAFGVNIGNFTDPKNGTGPVRRFKYVKGDGAGGAVDVGWYGTNWFDIVQAGGDPESYYLPPGVQYKTTYVGTVNNNSDVDTGWTTEIFLPWNVVGLSGPPTHGQTIGMNFDMIQNNNGGPRNLVDNRSNPDPNIRFLDPHFIDDHVQGVQSSYAATQAGIHGPVNYAEAMFIDPAAGARPAAITDLAVSNPSVFGARLNFTAPAGTTSGLGDVSAYQIRYSSAPITSDAAWATATIFNNNYVPRLRSLSESLRLAELSPATTYFVAVRAVDAAGNLSDLSNSVSLTTLALPSPGYQGAIIPSPNGRTLQFENGDPFVVVGDHLGVSWNYTRNLYPGSVWDNVNHVFQNFNTNPSYEGTAGPYFNTLQASGINTMRVYLELENTHLIGNPGPLPNGTYWIEDGPGVFNSAMQQFVNNVLAQAAAHGMYIIFSPFDTFSYDESFNVEGPWGSLQGGPLSSINDFFQTPATLDIAKRRMKALIDWVAVSPFKDHVLGWEFLSEWDSYEWTLQPSDNGEPGRETEFRTRAIYINSLAAYVKQQDPTHLVLNSTIARDPRGPIARVDFYSRNFDALTPHLYTVSNEEPINNPQPDKSILPAQEMGYFTSYWLTNRTDHAPLLNGEWGMTRASWPGGVPAYSAAFTQAQDEEMFRTVIWAGFASGQVGTGLRISTDELAWNGFILTNAMRAEELAFHNFVASSTLGFDFTNFNYGSLTGHIRATATGKTLLAWGVSDGTQGIAYVLQNGNVSSGSVTGAQLVITGLRPDQVVDAEVWSTLAGTTGPMATISGTYAGDGTLTLSLPAFTVDVAIKFKARATTSQSQPIVSINAGAYLVTFALGLDAQPSAYVINVSTGVATTQDIASLARFAGRVVDLTPFTTADGMVHLAVTDTNHHVWFFSGNIAAATWSAVDLTASIHAAGLTGDLTSYQPSWGAMHIAGLDARGDAVNYWWAPGLPSWQHSDLTQLLNGPTLAKGLTGYVAAWDGLNLAGLNSSGEVIVYWWAPGLTNWETVNMTTTFSGPALTGQLDAYVTPWGGLNVAGTNAAGHLYTYWWAPGMGAWETTDISAAAGGPTITRGTEVAVSSDGGINLFGIDASNDLQMLRWTPTDQVWRTSNVRALSSGPTITFPLSSAASGNRMIVGGVGLSAQRPLVVFSFFLDTDTWQADTTPLAVAG